MIELKTLRKSTHLTQGEIAEIMKVPVSTYSKWEQGINKPADSQIFLMCYYLYNSGKIITYLNDPNLSLTEMGLLMRWLRYDGPNYADGKRDICFVFEQHVSKDEANEIYKKLSKRYIVSRKFPRIKNEAYDLSMDEKKATAYRLFDCAGFEILPFDGSAIRGTQFAGDSYFFLERLAEILGMETNAIRSLLMNNDCHSDFYVQKDVSVKAQAVMNCLYYKYVKQFPLCFDVEDLIKYYGEEFYKCIEELKTHNYITLLDSGFYEFNTEYKKFEYGARFYINAKKFYSE